MKLSSCKKVYQQETHRTRSPEETYEIVHPLISQAGITRVADITGLDRIGIPIFSCIRPGAADGAISVYNGKGATEMAARVSAIMEGLERYSAEFHDRQCITSQYSIIRNEQRCLNPALLIIPESTDPDMPIPWVSGYDIINNNEIWVPAHAVFHPLPRFTARFFRTSTNGIASGNTYEEAVLHALCEIIERDAWSLAETSNNGGRVITNFTHPVVIRLLDAFHSAGVDVIIRDITSDNGIPTVAAIGDDTELRDPTLLCLGMGTHPCPEIAVLRALTEVAQSRATQIHGAREDTQDGQMKRQIGYDRTKRLNKKWFSTELTINFDDMPAYRSDDFLDDITHIITSLNRCGLEQVIAVDLTRPEIGIPVVRVIVPGLEQYAMDMERKGERCRNARRHYIPGTIPAT